MLNYSNAQFLLIGSHNPATSSQQPSDTLNKATQPQSPDQKAGKEDPIEEVEKLEEEDELRVEGLKGSDSEALFVDLGLDRQEFDAVASTW